MPDREKVIKGLRLCIDKHQCCMASPDEHCPYEDWQGEYEDSFYECTSRLAKDALALLKEQEAVKPEKKHSKSGITWWNVCGNCKTSINPYDKYCHECGRSVKLE